DRAIKNSLASRTKRFGDALKNVLWKFPHDPIEIPGFLDHFDNLFNLYEVDDDVRAKLLLANLSERAKALTMCLTSEQLDSYSYLKEFLLREFKLSPTSLKERFWTMRKTFDETYTVFAGKLRNALIYYLKSRKIKDEFDKLVSLLCADRLKETLSKPCLDYVLAQERGEWLSCEELANSVDIYVASHGSWGESLPRGQVTPRYNNRTGSSFPTQMSNTITPSKGGKPEIKNETKSVPPMSTEDARKKGLCFLCHQTGHMAKQCKTQGGTKKVGTCQVRFPIERRQEELDWTDEGEELEDTVETVRIEMEGLDSRPHLDVQIEDLSPKSALVDSGAEHCCIRKELVEHLHLPVKKHLNIMGLYGNGRRSEVVCLRVKLANKEQGTINIAPPLEFYFALLPKANEEVILTLQAAKMLRDTDQYTVMAVGVSKSEEAEPTQEKTDVEDEASRSQVRAVEDSFLDIEGTDSHVQKGVADNHTLMREQQNCRNLKTCWQQVKQNKGNFFVENNLLYHKGEIMGHKVNQLCLPESRVEVVLQLAHDAPQAGHMAFKATRARIKLSFWFPGMDDRIREYCATCRTCQLRSPMKVADRVPITPIPRANELCFNHLNMDCIGPMVPTGNSTGPKPKYNYALVLVDKFSRWPMAYPLRSLDAKGVCDALLQVFMTFSIPKVISSDCGTNFTSRLTQEFLRRMGCSPRFNTPGHPEAAGLVERCNQSLKTMIYKLAESNPRSWHQVLPFVLWSLREKPSDTTHISPFTMVYGTLPRGPLSVLKESWVGERELPLNLGKTPEKYLQSLRDDLEFAKAYADYYSNKEMKRYANNYNLRSTDRKYEVGDRVAVLAPDFGSSKFCNRWQGPATIVEVKSPYSYVVEIEGKKRHIHANKIKRYHERIEQAMISNCTVVYDYDEEFGKIDLIEKEEIDCVSPSKLVDKQKLVHLSEEEQRQLFNVLDKYPK
ncbi:MAG: DDE-type integrase/transposase/recombinase, partial [Nitrososphaeraceae archaeon]|nr:DDE-type integrase/transposase/recombinase [Nitrososphaeraceae archaeon]